eukprot:1159972-Pelagomonas_calceolata.AAC.7
MLKVTGAEESYERVKEETSGAHQLFGDLTDTVQQSYVRQPFKGVSAAMFRLNDIFCKCMELAEVGTPLYSSAVHTAL